MVEHERKDKLIMMRFVKKLLLPPSLQNLAGRLATLEHKVLMLEMGRQNRRNLAVSDLVGYLVSAQLPGDYCEFGVYQGDTFSYVHQLASRKFPEMRFFAFDSFEGLPKPQGLDALNGYTGNFHENEFAHSEEDFIANLKRNKVDLERVRTIKGWFDKTLTPPKVTKSRRSRLPGSTATCTSPRSPY
jgi:hypothetical protein